MKLTQLTVHQFRNLDALTLRPHENLNLIVGLNASGKTNLCEALYFASRGQLLKGERQRELIHWGCDWSTLGLEVSGQRMRIVLDGKGGGKTLELDGQAVRQSDAFDLFKVLIFTPDDLQTIKGSPTRRRHLLDRALTDIDPTYRLELAGYEQTVRRKNVLLRRERADGELMEVYNGQLAQRGAALVRWRLTYLTSLNDRLGPLHARLNQAGKRLELHYDGSVEMEDDFETTLAGALQRALPRERERGACLVGPHRDDVRFDLEGVDLRRYGSQGQQKTALIALKLAQLGLFQQRLGEFPVLILDDVLSELDPERTHLLLDNLPQDLQLFLTETELSAPLVRRAGKVFWVEQGRVRELSEDELCALRS